MGIIIEIKIKHYENRKIRVKTLSRLFAFNPIYFYIFVKQLKT